MLKIAAAGHADVTCVFMSRDRLRDEPLLCKIIEDLQHYFERLEVSHEDRCRVYLKRIEHLYYKVSATDACAPRGSPAHQPASDGTANIVILLIRVHFSYM